jgi:phosphoribosylanthranilate isomerase
VQLIAAGGLNPENVAEAVKKLVPHVVDVSSGVEQRPGIKNPEKVAAFIRSARLAGQGKG